MEPVLQSEHPLQSLKRLLNQSPSGYPTTRWFGVPVRFSVGKPPWRLQVRRRLMSSPAAWRGRADGSRHVSGQMLVP